MSQVATLLERVAPGLVAGYWRRRLAANELRRLYDAAKTTPQHRRPRPSGSGDATMQHARGGLRDWARWLDENSDIAVAILDTLELRIVGAGIVPEPMVRTRDGKVCDDACEQLRRLRDEWWESPETTGELSGGELQRQAVRTWLRDGEVFGQHLLGSRAYPYRGRVPYVVELLEPDLVPWELLRPDAGIVHGIEKDDWRRPVAYHFHTEHPGDMLGFTAQLRTLRVPADRITHLKWVSRIGQTRGVSIFHAVVHRLDDLKDYEESERIAARVAAAFTAVIRKAETYAPSVTASTTATGDRSFEMAPGMVFDRLLPGEQVDVIGSNRPNTGLDAFVSGQLRRTAGGTRTGASTISRDYSGTYSSQRQELVEMHQGYAAMHAHFVAKLVRPMWRRFVTAAELSGALRLPRDVDLDTLDAAEYARPPLPWIQPKQEIDADLARIDGRLASRHQIIRERGGDPRRVDAEILADSLTRDAPRTTAAPGERPAGEPEPDADEDQDEEAAA